MGTGSISNGFQSFLGIKLIDTAFVSSIFVGSDIGQSFHANLWTLHPFGQLIQLLACESSSTRNSDGHDGFSSIENNKVGIVDQAGIVLLIKENSAGFFQGADFHAETDVRLVVTILPHGIFPGHAFHHICVINAFDIFENSFYQSFKHVQNVFLFYKRHFTVDLRKLRLSVGSQILIPEAFNDLVVSIVTTHHQQLLEGLWGLGEGIKLSLIHSGRNYKISCTFWSGFDQERSFNIHELVLMQIIARRTVYSITQFKISLYGISSQIQITVFHPQIITTIGIILDGEGRHGRLVEDVKRSYFNLDFSSGYIHILVRPLNNLAFGLQNKFPSKRLLVQLFIQVFIEYQLGDTIAVAQVNKSDGAKFSNGLYPSSQGYLVSDMRCSQLPTGMRSEHDNRLICE